MGKVLKEFKNGYAGAVSRSVDDIIISLRNASGGEIAFGAPVFLVPGEKACRGFINGTSTAETFLGIAVRLPEKTPETYGSSLGCYKANEPVEILVRGSTVLNMESVAVPGDSVYIRKADGKLVNAAGSEGTTLQLPNVTVRTSRDTARRAEVVITKRNIM